MIECNNISFQYPAQGQGGAITALKNVSFSLERGMHLAILGQNGSGKSTLAQMLNGLLLPQSGTVTIDEMTTSDEAKILEIRRICGIVFQNPDNQIIGMTVEEDVAFGLENIGISRPEMVRRIDEALKTVGLAGMNTKAPYHLSGGQKQKLAIAGVFAMRPKYLILDEATAMLDPKTRMEIMELVISLCQEVGIGVINITHHMNEALLADKVIVLDGGSVVLEGTPRQVFANPETLLSHHLDIPPHLQTYLEVCRRLEVTTQPEHAFTAKEAALALQQILCQSSKVLKYIPQSRTTPSVEDKSLAQINHLSCIYNANTTQATIALNDVSFEIKPNEIIGVAGHTGSGKSTLIMHLNGLLRGKKGMVTVMGEDASLPNSIRRIRKKVGIVFQYPEHQLFEETVAQDIAFGPLKLGLAPSDAKQRVNEAASLVGLAPEILKRSPFELSGGQKRRVAMAGVLAMKPEVLILDEPAAGLDPEGRRNMLRIIEDLSKTGVTIILVSHNMDDLALLCTRILILKKGQVLLEGGNTTVFAAESKLRDAGLDVPDLQLFMSMMSRNYPNLTTTVRNVTEAANELIFQAGGFAKGGINQ